MKQVRIRHPQAGESTVAPSALPHWRSLGWEPIEDEPAAPPAAEGEPAAPPAAGEPAAPPAVPEEPGEQKKSSGRPRRRISKESDQ